MAAIIALHHAPAHRPDQGRAVDTAPRPAPAGDRPGLRVIEGGRSPRGRALRRMYLQRRVVAVLTLLVAAWALVSLGSAAADAVVGSPAGASASAGAPAAATHVVRSGDTLWSIASGLGVGGDVRDVVDALAEANDVEVLVPGQVLVIPAELTR